MADAIERFNNGNDSSSGDNVGITEAAVDAFEIAPDDANDITFITRGLLVGGNGDVKVTMKGGGIVTFKNVADGSLLPIRITRVWLTGTTAIDLIGLV